MCNPRIAKVKSPAVGLTLKKQNEIDKSKDVGYKNIIAEFRKGPRITYD